MTKYSTAQCLLIFVNKLLSQSIVARFEELNLTYTLHIL